MDCGVGNSRRDESWVPVGFQVFGGEMSIVSLWEGREELQVAWVRLGGEFWAVLGVFRALVRCGRESGRSGVSGWISEEERGSLAPWGSHWDLLLSSGINSLLSLSIPSQIHSDLPSFLPLALMTSLLGFAGLRQLNAEEG